MLRFMFFILLFWCCGEVAGQGVAIHKSTDVVVIRGKSFYLHTVEPGQTLYSICKAYGANLEEVKLLNDKKDNNLSSYEVLKIPYAEPFVQQDAQYYYHKVAKGETLYSIGRMYGIKPRRLLKYNEAYSQDKPLSVGSVVRLPLNEIDGSVLKRQEQTAEPALVAAKPAEKEEPGRDNVRQEKASVPAEVVVPIKHKAEQPETTGIPSETIRQADREKIPAYISEVVMPADPFVKVALLLPFSAKDYPTFVDSLAEVYPAKISARSEQFISFYEGILLAVDSLRNKGCKIELHVYDTERSTEKIDDITRQIDHFAPDLIIGPVYGSVYKQMAENIRKTTVPMVYPLSSRSENFGEYPNFVQVNTSVHTIVNAMADWLRKQSAVANIIQIDLGSEGGMEDEAERKFLTERLHEIHGVKTFNWNVADVPLDLLRAKLLPDRENIIVLPTIKEADVSKVLPILTALSDGYRITVLGFPEWQNFSSVDHETYFKLNTKIFTYSYVDYSSSAAQDLIRKYHQYFYTEPNSLVFKAFDIGIYFIDLAVKYRDRTLEAIDYYPAAGGFSRFRFEKMKDQAGKENHGLFIVNYGSDYKLKFESL